MKILIIFFLAVSSFAQEDSYMNDTDVMEILTQEFPAEEPGSGGGEAVEACEFHYFRYEKMYLRGVVDPNHISYNGTTFEECAKKCCYETKFECKSFSYMAILRQCFVMNVTQHDGDEYKLVDAPGHLHIELTEMPTTAPETTQRQFLSPGYRTQKNFPRTVMTRKTPVGNNNNRAEGISDKSVQSCPLTCQNGGICKIDQSRSSPQPKCDCPDEYSGAVCQNRSTATESGIPIWLIVVIVICVLLILLVAFVCIACHKYKKKTGEYRVVKALREWARLGRKPKHATSAEDFIDPDDTYVHPTMSIGSMYSSHTFSGTLQKTGTLRNPSATLRNPSGTLRSPSDTLRHSTYTSV